MNKISNKSAPVESFRKAEVCPQCGGGSTLFRTSGDVNKKTTDEVFNYYRCQVCGLVFMANIPPDMAPYYRIGYQRIPPSVTDLRKLAARERFRLRELLKWKSHGKLLEIGPWIGIFSINAQEAGFEVDAIEGNEACADFLREAVGIRVFQSNKPAEVLADMAERYDAIVLWHSLEHLPTPWLVIENASKALKPDGVLLVAIPNIDSYDSRLMREKWLHLDAPRHIYFYSPDALSALCMHFGLLPLYLSTSDRLSLNLTLQAWYHYIRRCSPLAYLRGMVGMTRNRGWGSGMTAAFRK